MRRSKLVRCITLVAAVLCVASLAIAQDTFTLTGANPNNNSYGSVYVSPYTATITDDGSTVFSGEVICDDYYNDVSVGDWWYVQSESLPGSDSGAMFASSIPDPYCPTSTCTSQQDYNAVAWLAEQLLALPLTDSYDQAVDSYAIWTIFDKGALGDASGISGAVTAEISTAFAATASGYSGPTVTIWTPTSTTPPGSAAVPQEFIAISAPEASLAETLALSLSTLLGVIFLLRRRLARG